MAMSGANTRVTTAFYSAYKIFVAEIGRQVGRCLGLKSSDDCLLIILQPRGDFGPGSILEGL
jgi:hypothetical protein